MKITYFKRWQQWFTFGIAALAAMSSSASCLTGPPGFGGNPAGFSPVLHQLLFACNPLITSDPINCSNPGNKAHEVFVDSALFSAGNLNEELVLTLPGSGLTATNTTVLTRSAAEAGYRAIGLSYEGDTLDAACGGLFFSAFHQCTEEFHSDVVYGGSSILRANSIEQRLLDLLIYMDGAFPTMGWDNYFTSGANPSLIYSKIILTGYSLGSTHAAYWAKDNNFFKLNTLSGPRDHFSMIPCQIGGGPCGSPVHTLANWIKGSHVTPGSARNGIIHVGEGQDRVDLLERALDELGVPANPAGGFLDLTYAWDAAAPALPWPYTGPEQRFSMNTNTGACTAHQATAADGCLAADMDPIAGVPRVVAMYMHMYCR